MDNGRCFSSRILSFRAFKTQKHNYIRDESNSLPLETVWFALRETNQTLRSQSGNIEKTPVWVGGSGFEPQG
jgi:hypothetical protein